MLSPYSGLNSVSCTLARYRFSAQPAVQNCGVPIPGCNLETAIFISLGPALGAGAEEEDELAAAELELELEAEESLEEVSSSSPPQAIAKANIASIIIARINLMDLTIYIPLHLFNINCNPIYVLQVKGDIYG
jgi:hypothetical protein